MKKPIITAVVIIALVVSIFCVARSCKSNSDYKNLKLQYAGYKAIAEAGHEISQNHIKELNGTIAGLTSDIAGKESEIAEKDGRIAALSVRLDELQNTEPPTTPEIEAMPIVINLRGQVARLTEMFSLAQETINTQREEIALWAKKYEAQAAISGEWQSEYEREHQLRLMSEGIVGRLERRVRGAKFLNKAAIVAVAGAVAYGLLK